MIQDLVLCLFLLPAIVILSIILLPSYINTLIKSEASVRFITWHYCDGILGVLSASLIPSCIFCGCFWYVIISLI